MHWRASEHLGLTGTTHTFFAREFDIDPGAKQREKDRVAGRDMHFPPGSRQNDRKRVESFGPVLVRQSHR